MLPMIAILDYASKLGTILHQGNYPDSADAQRDADFCNQIRDLDKNRKGSNYQPSQLFRHLGVLVFRHLLIWRFFYAVWKKKEA